MFNIGLLLALVCNLFGETTSEVSSYERVIKFVNSYPTKADETRCSYIDVNRDHFEYISKLDIYACFVCFVSLKIINSIMFS